MKLKTDKKMIANERTIQRDSEIIIEQTNEPIDERTKEQTNTITNERTNERESVLTQQLNEHTATFKAKLNRTLPCVYGKYNAHCQTMRGFPTF